MMIVQLFYNDINSLRNSETGKEMLCMIFIDNMSPLDGTNVINYSHIWTLRQSSNDIVKYFLIIDLR